MLKVHTPHAGHLPVCHRPGEVVLVRQGAAVEGRRIVKVRPAVIVEAAGSFDAVVPLTTTPRFVCGTPRVRMPDHERMGLHAESFVMGSAPHRIYRCDVLEHIGWVHRQAVAVIADAVVLHDGVAEQLQAAAEQMDGE